MKMLGFWSSLLFGMFLVFPYFLQGGYEKVHENHLLNGALGCTLFVAAGMCLHAAMETRKR